MLFIRTTLLLGLGVLLLPTDQESQSRVYANAKTALHWTTTFCERNPQTCVQGQQAWGVFAEKAEFGFKMALDLMNDRNGPKSPTGSAPTPSGLTTPNPRQVAAAPTKRASGTLQTSDLEPGWRGRVAKSSN